MGSLSLVASEARILEHFSRENTIIENEQITHQNTKPHVRKRKRAVSKYETLIVLL